MLVALGTAFEGNSNTLAVVDGLIMYRGRSVTQLTDVVNIATNGRTVVVVTRPGELYYFRFNEFRDFEPYTPDIRTLHDGVPVESVAMGGEHIIAVLSGGMVIGKGVNNYGCLGVEPTTPPQQFNRFVYIGGGDLAEGTAASVAAGNKSSAVIDVNGVLRVQGYNSFGQFGLGHFHDVYSWQRVNLKSVVVFAIERHSLAVLADGSMYATGNNMCGQLGTGHRDDLMTFTRVCGGVASAAVGKKHSVIVLRNGEVHECGHIQDSMMEIVTRFTRTEGLPAMRQVVTGGNRKGGVCNNGAFFEWGPCAGGFSEGPLPVLPHDMDLLPTMMLTGISLAERTRPLPETHVVAFAMGLHARIGAGNALRTFPDDVVRRIVETCAHVESASEKAMRGEWQ